MGRVCLSPKRDCELLLNLTSKLSPAHSRECFDDYGDLLQVVSDGYELQKIENLKYFLKSLCSKIILSFQN